ncbi:MAG: zinc ribbon domain-containing protein [Halobacteriota archaeon]
MKDLDCCCFDELRDRTRKASGLTRSHSRQSFCNTHKKNRKPQAEFVCVSCGLAENAEINAAKNIASRAVDN